MIHKCSLILFLMFLDTLWCIFFLNNLSYCIVWLVQFTVDFQLVYLLTNKKEKFFISNQLTWLASYRQLVDSKKKSSLLSGGIKKKPQIVRLLSHIKIWLSCFIFIFFEDISNHLKMYFRHLICKVFALEEGKIFFMQSD